MVHNLQHVISQQCLSPMSTWQLCVLCVCVWGGGISSGHSLSVTSPFVSLPSLLILPLFPSLVSTGSIVNDGHNEPIATTVLASLKLHVAFNDYFCYPPGFDQLVL